MTGNFRGTSDEVIQWAAHKWGFHPDLLRAVATVESWWRMSAIGDGGASFGLFQMRRPYHCCLPLMSGSSAFNADYYGGILRAYYDGKQGWLNTVERGRDYRAGDLWGSVGAWFSGRWHWGGADAYAARVGQHLRPDLAGPRLLRQAYDRSYMARLRVRLQPRARQDTVAGERDGALVVRVTAPPVDGRANEALCRLIARRARVARGRVAIVRGERGREKLVEVEGMTDAELSRALGLSRSST